MNFYDDDWGEEKPEDPFKKKKMEILNDSITLRLLGDGDKKAGRHRFIQLLKRKVYWRHELTEDEFCALKKYGYQISLSRSRSPKYVVRGEQGTFEQVVCLLPGNENMQHMRDKEKMASLRREMAEIEYLVPETRKRIDVGFFNCEYNVAVEIQNSALEYMRLKDKVQIIESNFEYWYLVVPKKLKGEYQYLASEKGKVLCMKEALQDVFNSHLDGF